LTDAIAKVRQLLVADGDGERLDLDQFGHALPALGTEEALDVFRQTPPIEIEWVAGQHDHHLLLAAWSRIRPTSSGASNAVK
jgi:hypothetical protein